MTLPGFPEADPLGGLIGGILIGLAAAIMLLGAGRIAGVSGILGRAIWSSGPGISRGAAWLFVLGLPVGAGAVMLLKGGAVPQFAGPVQLALAGLLVGIGTRMGSGCTSGHGVCGVSRLSPRSLVATAVFMGTGIATVAAMNALGLEVVP
jgi:uncharacterized membrane protein YedE/YeeE